MVRNQDFERIVVICRPARVVGGKLCSNERLLIYIKVNRFYVSIF